jgi:hypothetical protein
MTAFMRICVRFGNLSTGAQPGRIRRPGLDLYGIPIRMPPPGSRFYMRPRPSSEQRGRRFTACDSRSSIARSVFMLDFILVATAIGFFALSVAYAYGCDRL